MKKYTSETSHATRREPFLFGKLACPPGQSRVLHCAACGRQFGGAAIYCTACGNSTNHIGSLKFGRRPKIRPCSEWLPLDVPLVGGVGPHAVAIDAMARSERGRGALSAWQTRRHEARQPPAPLPTPRKRRRRKRTPVAYVVPYSPRMQRECRL